jgi:hypothetical protein
MTFYKFRNRPTRCRQGVMHQSMAESRRCDELHLMESGDLIRELRAHPQERFRLDVNGTHICDYLADFTYQDCATEERICEDVKGHRTREYELKKKLMLACHGIDVREVRVR